MKNENNDHSMREALEVSEIRYRRLFESARDGILILDTATGKVLDVNPFLTELLGYSREEFLNKALWELGFFRDIAANREKFDELREKRYVRYEHLPLETASGGSVDVEFVSNVYQENQSEVIQCNIRDITERKRTADMIAAEKERLRVTLRSIGDGVITTDANGNIDILNVVAEELCGWSVEDAHGKPLAEVFNIINETTRKPHDNPVEKVLATGKVIELENHTVIISKTGTERIIADSAAPIMDVNGAITGVVLVFRDITEKQKLLEAGQRNQKLESLGALAAGIAHDFNNLMGGIFGYIDIALSASKEEKVRSRLAKAVNTIERARDLTRQLLTFASGGAPIMQTTTMADLIEKTASFALSGSHARLKCSLPDNLWTCEVDRNQIAQVIENIVINAQQAMAGNGIIEVSAENSVLKDNEHAMLCEGNYVKLTIKDSGIGMSNATLSRIFDPFFTTKNMGHGLGLATCYSIINRHNGAIEVKSAIDKGSTFTIYFHASQESVPVQPEIPCAHEGSGTVIIMDDEEVMRETLSDMLDAFDYKVIESSDGAEALKVFTDELQADRSITALFLDLTVPGGLGGNDIIQQIRKVAPEIPVFVVSGYANDPIVQNPAEFGFTASICKPFRLNELKRMLSKVMDN